jgi:adenylate kinase family enzyme
MRIAIMGNSGSGKSSLARTLDGPILDLDTIFWEPNQIAVKRDSTAVLADLDAFIARDEWIIEGVYGGLIERALALGPELTFCNPGERACLANCRGRPWEPHKYPSKEAQDSMLEPLLAWVSAYYTRDDDMSLARHRAIFDAYAGPKGEIDWYEVVIRRPRGWRPPTD